MEGHGPGGGGDDDLIEELQIQREALPAVLHLATFSQFAGGLVDHPFCRRPGGQTLWMGDFPFAKRKDTWINILGPPDLRG